MADSMILMILALVVFGPRRLPQIGRQLGKLMYEFRKASNDFKFQMEEELRNAEEADRRKREEAERQRTLAETQKALGQAQDAAELAMNAAAQAQTAAQAAQSAAAPEPYPDDPGYDDLDAELAPPPPAVPAPAESAAAPPPSAPPALRIQPPSTGQQIAAARPNRAEGVAAEPAGGVAAPEDHPAAAESTARHG